MILCLFFIGMGPISIAQSFKVLHYTETSGHDHKTRDESIDMFNEFGAASNFAVTDDQTGTEFNTLANLQQYNVVVFSNTSGDNIFNATQRQNFEDYIAGGGNYLGIHAGSDTYRHSTANGGNTGTWDFYPEMMGASVQESPNHTNKNHNGTMDTIGNHASCQHVPDPWNKVEEYYYWEDGYLANDIVEVLRVRSTGSDSHDTARPMSWYRDLSGGGKAFYTALGHHDYDFDTVTLFGKHVRDALLWLLDTSADCSGGSASYEYNNGWVTDPSGVSTSCDSINIIAGDASISSNTDVSTLTIAPGATLDLNSNTLSVSDTAYLLANSSGYAQVIGKIEGITQWQVYLGSSAARWYNNAFPVKAAVDDIEGALINITNDEASQNIFYLTPLLTLQMKVPG
ncbi:MAG: ThuA domain-containing protein [Owenweeksia sp.]|nr:ThuA domain-containing protein [Owenweeksia sp.]